MVTKLYLRIKCILYIVFVLLKKSTYSDIIDKKIYKSSDISFGVY